MSQLDQPAGSETESRHYEFDEHEDTVFRDLAGAMKAVGKAMLILGPLLVLFGIVSLAHKQLVSAAVEIVVGACLFMFGNWNGDAANSIAKIPATQGNDITHLISGMIDLKKIYGLQRLVLLIGLAACGLGLIVGLISMIR
jgi:hypothetical protein